eukprot:GHVT01093121.1.p2 GENE.GHVT01093121.1~~GHVT01093121.1.p2  ORF type:complete len:102 (-),score=5.14 GHVT01093121.1:744-1049(-)
MSSDLPRAVSGEAYLVPLSPHSVGDSAVLHTGDVMPGDLPRAVSGEADLVSQTVGVACGSRRLCFAVQSIQRLCIRHRICPSSGPVRPESPRLGFLGFLGA